MMTMKFDTLPKRFLLAIVAIFIIGAWSLAHPGAVWAEFKRTYF